MSSRSLRLASWFAYGDSPWTENERDCGVGSALLVRVVDTCTEACLPERPVPPVTFPGAQLMRVGGTPEAPCELFAV